MPTRGRRTALGAADDYIRRGHCVLPPGGTFARRTFLVTALFAVALGVVANLAWIVSLRTAGLAFSEVLSIQVYAITFALASVLACGIVTAASVRALQLEEALRVLHAGIAALDHPSGAVADHADLAEPSDAPTVSDAELDDLLDVLEGSDVAAVLGGERAGHDSLADEVRVLQGSTTDRHDLIARLRKNRDRIQAVRSRVWRLAIGPLAVATLFVALAGAMLPASPTGPAGDGRLNATVLLFLAFGWPILAGWSALGLTLGKSTPELAESEVPG